MTFATPIAATINHLLARQPALQATLAAHKGKVACVAIGALTLRLQVAADGLLTAPSESANHPHTEANPNVTIRISPADVPQILANRARAFSYVSLEGDADFAKSISEIANNLHWEAEEDLAPWVGDIAAVRLVQGARAAAAALQAGGKNLAESVADYLLEENPVLLHRQCADDFAGAVATLRDDAERLAKRVTLLEQTLAQQAGAAR
jgi:ubiquinone biosynthesis protein UbiJ